MEGIPEVSVIIPAFNAARYLARAADSVLAQEGCRYELIIVDNNSTDATVEIARDYGTRYPAKVRLFVEANPGASAARNRGITSARAPWIQFLDADDILLPGKLKRQLAITEADVDWIIGTIRIRNQDGRETDATIATDPWRGLLTYTGLGHLDANLFRADTLRKLGGFNEAYLNCNDFELFFRLVKTGCRYREDLIPGAVHIHHVGPRITTTNRADMARRRLELTDRIIDHLKTNVPCYAQKNYKFINTALLRVLRKQATVDIGVATEQFQTHFPEGYRKGDFEQTEMPVLSAGYPMFGFGPVERFRVEVVKILPAVFRKWLKA